MNLAPVPSTVDTSFAPHLKILIVKRSENVHHKRRRYITPKVAAYPRLTDTERLSASSTNCGPTRPEPTQEEQYEHRVRRLWGGFLMARVWEEQVPYAKDSKLVMKSTSRVAEISA